MRTSRNYIIGVILLIIGFTVLLDHLHIIRSAGSLIPVLFFVGLGYLFYTKKRKVISTIFFGLSALIFLDAVLGVDGGGIVIPVLLIYFGYRLIRGKKKQAEVELPVKQPSGNQMKQWEKELDEWIQPKTEPNAKTMGTPEVKSALLGDFYLTEGRFALNDMNIWHGIGDVKIDLSKALIPERETVIVINGWIGDIDIYVPYDLDVSVTATVTIGDFEVFGHKQGGLNRSLSVATNEYGVQPRKVRMVLSLFIGDIDVRYI